MTAEQIADDILNQHGIRGHNARWDGDYLKLLADIEGAIIDARNQALEEAAQTVFDQSDTWPRNSAEYQILGKACRAVLALKSK